MELRVRLHPSPFQGSCKLESLPSGSRWAVQVGNQMCVPRRNGRKISERKEGRMRVKTTLDITEKTLWMLAESK